MQGTGSNVEVRLIISSTFDSTKFACSIQIEQHVRLLQIDNVLKDPNRLKSKLKINLTESIVELITNLIRSILFVS